MPNKACVSPKVIATDSGLRAAQACDRCRIKKTRCDGASPCSKCVSVGLACTVSDKLARRSFPKGYTVNLERRIKDLENEIRVLKSQSAIHGGHQCSEESSNARQVMGKSEGAGQSTKEGPESVIVKTNDHMIQINNPIDQIFNLDGNGLIIGNDNLNFESQLNHLLINLKLPFLKLTNSHNFLLDDPDSYLLNRSYTNYNSYHNKDLEVIYNPLTMKGLLRGTADTELPTDVYDLFIKLVSNFKKIFESKKSLDQQIVQFFLNYNTFIPIFEYGQFMQDYDAFHTMFPFMFTYDDATINGFNFSTNDYQVVNEYLILVIQIYAMILMNDPSLNLNLLLNHKTPNYTFRRGGKTPGILVSSLYDFLPYLNIFHVSVNQLHTYLLFLYYSLITNNKEKSLVLSSLINAFIGILGVNLNCKNLFFNDLSLTLSQRRDRVKIFWAFKVLLKCFNLKFGFKPTINTTVINPVTIERYFKLTPEKLSLLINPALQEGTDSLFETFLSPSVEFLNLMNIVIPSSFSPNYYEYLKQDRHNVEDHTQAAAAKKGHTSHLDWILNDDDGDGNDGNLNYNYNQFLSIDKNLSNWRYSLKDKILNTVPFKESVGLALLSSAADSSLYFRISFDGDNIYKSFGISQEGLLHYANTGLPDVHTATQLIKMQLNFHYLVIRSMNYLNFVIERELTLDSYVKIANISREVLAFFILIFQHVGNACAEAPDTLENFGINKRSLYDPFPSAFDIDEEGFVVNDFSARRNRKSASLLAHFPSKVIPSSPFNSLLNGLALTTINLKKVIMLQILYLLICNLKISKSGGTMNGDTLQILEDSISLFIKIFINYQPKATRPEDTKRLEEFHLFRRIINDEMQDEVLNDNHDESDVEDAESTDIDWDDENLDEDLKYLRILKYIKYKTKMLSGMLNKIHADGSRLVRPTQSSSAIASNTNDVMEAKLTSTSLANLLNSAVPASFLMQYPASSYTHDVPYQYATFGRHSSLSKFENSMASTMNGRSRQERELANDLMSMRDGETRRA